MQPHSMLEDSLEGATDAAEHADAPALSDKEWTLMFRDALTAASSYQTTKLRSQWSRNYRAFSNRHMQGSKYDTLRYRHRSKLFRPKTRMAVRKNDATAASAMFSTEDVVSIAPERASDRVQVMTARFVHEALNYRLDRDSPMTGPSWFLTAIGARQDAQLTGICVSKQYWQYETRRVPAFVERPLVDEFTGLPMFDEEGFGLTEEVIEDQNEVVADRLMIDLVPGEHALIDPTGDWRDPIQTGGYFIAAFPTREEDLKAMIRDQSDRPRMGGGEWRTGIDVGKLVSARGDEKRNSQSVRRAREDGVDRYESRFADKNGDVLWLYEVFYRYGGTDWHFWMLGEHMLLSDPRPVEESYPAHKGLRPYVRGLGSLETHRVVPQAPVEAWQPLQQEINDIGNLRLDGLKMSISPITKIRRGRNVDFKQVQNRGPDAMIMVTELDDVSFDRAPTPPSETQLDINNLNTDFDELAGIFSQGSVQTNRQLNETVGGMNLLAGSANSLTEFDLRVWVETWAEPVLRQCVMLIQHYETSEVVIAVAGEKAGLLANMPSPVRGQEAALERDEDEQDPIPLSVVMENLDAAAISVRVNVGIGALDSRQKLEKFMGGVKMTLEMAPLLAADGIVPNGKEMMQEGWGLLGYRDATRFFKTKAPDQSPPPEVQIKQMELQARGAEKQLDSQTKLQIAQINAGVEQAGSEQEASIEQERLALDRDAFDHQRQMDMLELQLRRLNDTFSQMMQAQAPAKLPTD